MHKRELNNCIVPTVNLNKVNLEENKSPSTTLFPKGNPGERKTHVAGTSPARHNATFVDTIKDKAGKIILLNRWKNNIAEDIYDNYERINNVSSNAEENSDSNSEND